MQPLSVNKKALSGKQTGFQDSPRHGCAPAVVKVEMPLNSCQSQNILAVVNI